MSCCNRKCAKWTTIISSIVVLVLGILLAVLWEKLYNSIIFHELSVSNKHTIGFNMWKETPIPMYLEFHLFNWTNPDNVQKYPGVKPSFVEMGPYTFHEHHVRENISFNDNGTITYLTKRTWQFVPEMTDGSLDDNITMLNPIVVVVTNQIKDEHYIVKRAVNFFLEDKGENLAVTKKVREVLFDGYDDDLLDIALKLNMSNIKIPFKKFGWFVDRNGSAEYDGVFNMYDGLNDISQLGLITKWNYKHKTPYYSGECSIVNGSSGELWYPPRNDEEVSIFSPDLCSSVNLRRNGTNSLYGVEGNLYEGQADVFDNGTHFKNKACFASGMPTGVRDVSACKFNAPAYMSFPHFYLADPLYAQSVDGMSPDKKIHSTRISLEPSTGLPLRVYAAFQLNLLMRNMKGIDILANVQETLMPCFWFAQKAELSEDLSNLTKFLLIARKVGTSIGYGFIGIGSLLFGTFVYITYKKGWSRNEEEQLLVPQN